MNARVLGGLRLAVLAALLAAGFVLSVVERRASFGVLEGRPHEWLTGSTVKFTKNWFHEGAWNLRFAMLENPRSIEFPDLKSREPYVSYPVGCLLPVYATSLLLKQPPSAALVMAIDLGNQLLGALAVFAIVWLALKDLGIAMGPRLVFGALAYLMYVGLPGPMYWFQNVYFSDQAILLPVLLSVLCEVVLDGGGSPGWLVAQSLVVGWGAFTDWLMVPVGATLLAKKLVTCWLPLDRGQKLARSVLFLLPSFLGVTLFLAQVASLQGFGALAGKFLNRAGLATSTNFHFSQLYTRFWKTYLPANFGGAAPWLLVLSVVTLGVLYFLYKRRGAPGDAPAEKLVRLSFLLVFPPLLHSLVFWQHTVDHSFTPLRFLPAFVCLPFVFVPLLVMRRFGAARRESSVLMIVAVAAGLIYLASGHFRLEDLKRARRPELASIGTSLQEDARFEDVLFSPDLEVPANPPELLSYSMKRVYKLGTPAELALYVPYLPARARIRVVLLSEPQGEWRNFLAGVPPTERRGLLYYDLGSVSDLERARIPPGQP